MQIEKEIQKMTSRWKNKSLDPTAKSFMPRHYVKETITLQNDRRSIEQERTTRKREVEEWMQVRNKKNHKNSANNTKHRETTQQQHVSQHKVSSNQDNQQKIESKDIKCEVLKLSKKGHKESKFDVNAIDTKVLNVLIQSCVQ